MGTGCFCHLLFFPLIIMQIGHSLQHFLLFCLFKQYFCEPTWQSCPGTRVHRYNETEFTASLSFTPFPPVPLPPAASAGPAAGSGAGMRRPGRDPLSLSPSSGRSRQDPHGRRPGGSVAGGWRSLSRGCIGPGTVADAAEAPAGAGTRPALRGTPSAL